MKTQWKVDLPPALASVVIGLRAARDLVQQAQAIIENLPSDTVYDDQIADFREGTFNMGVDLDDLAADLERS